jgi:hypothetical protein
MPNIPVASKGRRIRFLHAAFWGFDPMGTQIGKYVLHFAGGDTIEKPLVLGSDILDINGPTPARDGNPKVAMTFKKPDSDKSDKECHLYLTTLDNPYPETQITSLDFISFHQTAAPFLVAVTVE